MDVREVKQLRLLAKLHGIQTSYLDVAGQRVTASSEALQAVLSALGTHARDAAEVDAAILSHTQSHWAGIVEPVIVAWSGRCRTIPLRLPARANLESIRGTVTLESGEQIPISDKAESVVGEAIVAGKRYCNAIVPLGLQLPPGYHSLSLTGSGISAHSTIISAPRRVFAPVPSPKEWGLFAPAYSLTSDSVKTAGNFSTLRQLMEWSASQGARLIGTLPLLPAFLSEPFEPSPYSPVSRVAWNDFYLDLERIPEWTDLRKSTLRPRSRNTPPRPRHNGGIVHYREEMATKREHLEDLARLFFGRESARRDQFDLFLKQHPAIAAYARFRAVMERQQAVWTEWPDRLRAGGICDADFDLADFQYHAYAQWNADEQMRALASTGKQLGVRLYLDMPLGVNSAGFDAWRGQDLFALQASGGAPPDAVFTKGQDWGFAPLHPQRARLEGYRYMIDYLRHHLQYAGMLRIDHVMGLHRLYWVPHGASAAHGAYVSYPHDELYAVLSLESHRHQCVIVGENLGTVPPAVNAGLRRHGIREMFVVQYEIRPDQQQPMRPVPPLAVASLNTHDMPPFAAFWNGDDLQDRKELGLLTDDGMRAETETRRQMREALIALLRRKKFLIAKSPGPREVLAGVLKFLATSDAEYLLINIEDLWLETASQNVPGTTGERINWRRQIKYSIQELAALPEVAQWLRTIDAHRKGKGRL